MESGEVKQASYREYIQKVEWYKLNEESEWKRTRYVAWQMMVLNPYLKTKPKSPEDLFRIGDEIKEAKGSRLSISEEQKSATKAFFNKLGGEVIL